MIRRALNQLESRHKRWRKTASTTQDERDRQQAKKQTKADMTRHLPDRQARQWGKGPFAGLDLGSPLNGMFIQSQQLYKQSVNIGAKISDMSGVRFYRWCISNHSTIPGTS